jgi:8-oxo-dGTP pyrophosphatase MutT (NUDIX family)
MREAREETGIREVEPLSPAIQSLDILPVWGHEKQGRYVTAHLHLSVGYALTAPENQLLAAKTDENSGVRWVSVRQLEQYVTEPYMLYIYRKIGARLGAF